MRAFIAGDVWPMALGPDELERRLQLSRPELFVFTLDACVPAGPPRGGGHVPFPFDPEALDGLALGAQNVVVTASNHLGDYGAAGFRATLDALEQRKLRTSGAGRNLDEAMRPCVIDTAAGRIAILAFAETIPRVAAVPADAAAPGVAPWSLESGLAAVQAARGQSDFVWVILHWGEEFVHWPDSQQRAAAHALVRAGAGLVAASHTHVPLGFERVEGGTIFYGLGNFIYGGYSHAGAYHYRWHPMGKLGVVAEGTFDGSWRWRPVVIRHDDRGLPRRSDRAEACPDLGAMYPFDPATWPRDFAALRRRDRLRHRVERLIWMTADERLWRLHRLMRLRR